VPWCCDGPKLTSTCEPGRAAGAVPRWCLLRGLRAQDGRQEVEMPHGFRAPPADAPPGPCGRRQGGIKSPEPGLLAVQGIHLRPPSASADARVYGPSKGFPTTLRPARGPSRIGSGRGKFAQELREPVEQVKARANAEPRVDRASGGTPRRARFSYGGRAREPAASPLQAFTARRKASSGRSSGWGRAGSSRIAVSCTRTILKVRAARRARARARR
jgi:hypothetical protein